MGLRVKKLEWEKSINAAKSFAEVWHTTNDIACYAVWKYAETGRCEVTIDFGEDSDRASVRRDCDSIEHGKQVLQQHWESQEGIGKYLEEWPNKPRYADMIVIDDPVKPESIKEQSAETDAAESVRPQYILCKSGDLVDCQNLLNATYGKGDTQ